MFNSIRVIGLLSMSLLLAGCYTTQGSQSSTGSTLASGSVNCKQLERQRIYNMTNMNTETNNTTYAQREELNQLIQKNCH